MVTQATTNIVKVRYIFESTGELSVTEYSYFATEPLNIGDIVMVPVRDTIGKAKVTAINVPEAAIAPFKDKVKTIPAGARVVDKIPPIALLGYGGVNDTPVSPIDVSGLDKSVTPAINDIRDQIESENLPIFPEDAWSSSPPTDEEINADIGVIPEDPVILSRVSEISPATQALVNIAPTVDPVVVKLLDEITRFQKYASNFKIANIEDAQRVTEDLAACAGLKKRLEEKRKEYVAPLNEHTKNINAAFHTLSDPLDMADKTLRATLTAWQAKQMELERKAKELKQLEEAAAAKRTEILHSTGEILDAPPVVAVPLPETDSRRIHSNLATAGTTKTWTFEITDFSKLPDDYKMVDASKLNKVIKAAKGTITIAGVKIIEQGGVRITPKAQWGQPK